jgi:hypothetical protein
VQPAALLTGGEVHVCIGPAPRPVILCAIEGGAAQPVGQCELFRVTDSQPALLGEFTMNKPPSDQCA